MALDDSIDTGSVFRNLVNTEVGMTSKRNFKKLNGEIL